MSRLIIKNLPKNVNDAKLKELFSQKGVVTDVQLKYTKDGKFRRFGFIGFKTEEQANAAREYFDKTCIDTCRISVETCANLGDPSKPKSWSKYAPDSSHSSSKKDVTEKDEKITANEKDEAKEKKQKSKKERHKKDEIKEALKKHKDDPLFVEFLESHASGDKKSIWSNDTLSDIINKDAKHEDSDESTEDEDEEKEKSDMENDAAGVEKEEKQEGEKIADKVITDLEYMEALKKKGQIDQKTPTHGSAKFFTVKIRGLKYNHKKKDIKQFFRPLKAKSIRVPQKVKGIAYVGFKTEQQLRKALLKNKSFLDGKQILVTKYEHKEDAEAEKENQNDVNVKWKKQEEE